MRYKPRNHREKNPEIFEKLVKNNPYLALIYDYPGLIIPHPTAENFQRLWSKKIKAVCDSHSQKLHLEIGCGSGRYLIEWARKNPQDSFIGLELRYKRLVLAAKKIEQQTITNILLMRERGEFIYEYLPYNSIDYMHINFPDPWSKKAHRKHRIISADFLSKMHPHFSSGGELRFKTDHIEYFETVTSILEELKIYTILEHTTNLYGSDYNQNNILTEFEMLFKSKGNPPIGYLRAISL